MIGKVLCFARYLLHLMGYGNRYVKYELQCKRPERDIVLHLFNFDS